MKAAKWLVRSYLFCFLLVITVDLLGKWEMPWGRIYLVVMPLLALSMFLFSDLSSGVIKRRLKDYRWSITILLAGVIASLFVDGTLTAGIVILVTAFIAALMRKRRYAGQD